MGQPQPILSLFSNTKFHRNKLYLGFSGIQTRIDRVKGRYTDHLTNLGSQQLSLVSLIIWPFAIMIKILFSLIQFVAKIFRKLNKREYFWECFEQEMPKTKSFKNQTSKFCQLSPFQDFQIIEVSFLLKFSSIYLSIKNSC